MNGRAQDGHQTDDRILTCAELEGLLAWWRTTAKDNHGEPLFCVHHEHAGACQTCTRLRTPSRRQRRTK